MVTISRRRFGTLLAATLGPTLVSRTPALPFTATLDLRTSQQQATDTVTGIVFDDLNKDGVHQANEPGVRGVLVSNGLDVVRTDADGRYRLPVRPDMSVFVVKPSGWRTPTNGSFVPQFAYQHKPAGSPRPLRFGGLPATGPIPSAINFPLVRADESGLPRLGRRRGRRPAPVPPHRRRRRMRRLVSG